MTFKSTFLPVLMCFCALLANAGSTITTVITPTNLCQGDSFTLAMATPDTFAPGNVFYIQLSDSSGSFAHPVVIDSFATQLSDTANFATPSVSKNSAHYKIRIVSTSDSISLFNTALTIHNTPNVNFQLPQPSYCTYAYNIPLSGGTPVGGVYSGTDVANGAFQSYLSGVGTFAVSYTYTDSIGCSAGANSSITIASCPSPSVAVQVSPAGICQGSSVNITIQTSDVLGSDNIFTVQLSDSTGSFANPTVIAIDTNPSGNTITTPAPVEPAGTHYKVRVLASDPAIISVPFNVTFRQQLAAPAITLNASGTKNLCKKDSFNLKIDSLYGISYQWMFNGNPIHVNGYRYTAKDSGIYTIFFTDTVIAGCSSGADSVFIGVYQYPAKPVVSPHGKVNSCGTNPVALSTPSVNGINYQWIDHGQNISNGTSNTYLCDSTGIYMVKAIYHGCATHSDSVYVNILNNPHVTVTLPFDSFCVNSAPINLTGGSPAGAGGYFTGNFVSGIGAFNPAASGVGTFEIRYTFVDSIGCSGSDSTKVHVFNCTTSGISEVTTAHGFEMFPNPASSKVTIDVSSNGNCKMRLFNLLGQEMGNHVFNQQLNFSLEGFSAGVYMVEISDSNDSWKTVKRLVVQ